MFPLITNSVTTQGLENDVESNFTIDPWATQTFTPKQLRALVSSDSFCYKVVSSLSQGMGDVSFEVKATVSKRSKNISTTITWLNNCLSTLIPWFVLAQTQANIVGKAYLVFDVISTIKLENPYNYFPLISPTPYQHANKQTASILPLKVLTGDEYWWTKDNKYLVRNYTYTDSLQINTWVNDKVKTHKNDLEKIKSLQYEIIESSHIIEFTAFDYQVDKLTHAEHSPKTVKLPYVGISFRLLRFLPALFRYLSFVNATLNRMHRSESVVYKKENLGETNQAIARFMSQTVDNQLVSNITELIQNELVTLRNSLKNFGVALIDKNNDIEMISRSMTGIDNLDKIFSKDLIAASGLTEYSLFGITFGGGGLASIDIRDRMAIAKQTDELFANHWKPYLLYLANCLGFSSEQLTVGTHSLFIQQTPSFKLSQLESSEWLEKRIKILLDLKKEGVIDNVTVLNELSGNGELGQYFAINQSDVIRLQQQSQQQTQ